MTGKLIKRQVLERDYGTGLFFTDKFVGKRVAGSLPVTFDKVRRITRPLFAIHQKLAALGIINV